MNDLITGNLYLIDFGGDGGLDFYVTFIGEHQGNFVFVGDSDSGDCAWRVYVLRAPIELNGTDFSITDLKRRGNEAYAKVTAQEYVEGDDFALSEKIHAILDEVNNA